AGVVVIGRVRDVAARVADSGGDHAGLLADEILHPPEAAAGHDRRLTVFRHVVLLLPGLLDHGVSPSVSTRRGTRSSLRADPLTAEPGGPVTASGSVQSRVRRARLSQRDPPTVESLETLDTMAVARAMNRELREDDGPGLDRIGIQPRREALEHAGRHRVGATADRAQTQA